MSQVQITPASLPIKVGLVGYGMAGRTFHAPLIQASPELELTAVVSRHAERILSDLPGVEVLSRLEYLLERHDIDLIVIATPNEAHLPTQGRRSTQESTSSWTSLSR